MKRINAIVRAKDKISETVNRKIERILRGVDTAIACAEDSADEAKDTAYEIMNSLGEASSKDDTSKLQKFLNDYAAKMEEADRWTAYAGYFRDLKKKLEEDVKTED